MARYTVKQINLTDIKEGMVLAKDTIYSNGVLIFPEDTVMTNKHILKLSLYDIKYVYVKDFIEDLTYKKKTIKKELTPQQIRTKDNFVKFSKHYKIQEVNVKDNLNKISTGQSVKITDLFSISTNLVNDLGTQSDLFNHLCHLKASNNITYTHCLNVSMLCNIFGRWLHFTDSQIESLTIAGLLHDIGKTKIDPSILNKPEKELTQEEFEIFKQHPQIGYDIIKDKNLDEDIKEAVLQHHENIDGSGYPSGLSWNDIHPYAKIISIVDMYDTMTSEKNYRKRYSPFKVIKIIEEDCYGILDTEYMYVFLEHIAYNYIGCLARLSTGEECEIKFIHKNCPSRPIVQVDNNLIDLEQESDIYIEEIL